MPETPSIETSETRALASRLFILAIVLILGYVVSVLGAILPPRLLDPVWQLRLGSSLVENAPIPLVALAFLHLAAYLQPNNHTLQARRRAIGAWAIAAAIGFLLLVPLQGFASWQVYSNATLLQNRQFLQTNQKIGLVRTAVIEATSLEDLRKRLQAIQGPQMMGDFTQPLPKIKQVLLANLKQAEQQFAQQFPRQANPESIWDLVQRCLRGMLASLIFALGFASLGQRPGKQVSLLEEWRFAWRLRRDRAARRKRERLEENPGGAFSRRGPGKIRQGLGKKRSGPVDQGYLDHISRDDH